MDNLTDNLKAIALEAAANTLRQVKLKQLKNLTQVINDLHEIEPEEAEELHGRLRKRLKLDIEYCEHCDFYRAESGWYETNKGDYICESCYEALADKAHDMLCERDYE